MTNMGGYEKVAGLMTKHAEVATFQRFDFLNTLNILYLQAELVHLEQELRESMREDLEYRNDATVDDSLYESRDEIEISQPNNTEEQDLEKGAVTYVSTRETSTPESELNVRLESTRDWRFLAEMDDSKTWDIMLKTREKLKEYSSTSRMIEKSSLTISQTKPYFDTRR